MKDMKRNSGATLIGLLEVASIFFMIFFIIVGVMIGVVWKVILTGNYWYSVEGNAVYRSVINDIKLEVGENVAVEYLEVNRRAWALSEIIVKVDDAVIIYYLDTNLLGNYAISDNTYVVSAFWRGFWRTMRWLTVLATIGFVVFLYFRWRHRKKISNRKSM